MRLEADIVVIGAGPAGACAALALHAGGIRDVVVLDAAVFPRVKPCGGAVARRGIELLAELGVPLRVRHEVLSGAEIRGGGRGISVGTRSARPIGVVVRREELDHDLVRSVRGRGIDVHEGARVVSIGPFENGARVVHTSAGEIRARCVIGADGATSLAGKQIRAERGGPAPRMASAMETFSHAGADDPARGRMRYDFSLGEHSVNGRARTRGYAWDFPCLLEDGQRGFNRGLYTVAPRELPRSLPRQMGVLLRARSAKRSGIAKSWPERLYDERRPVSAPGLFLAGEAIGVNPVTGEGIAPAIESALFAARWAARSLRHAAASNEWEGYTHAFRRSMLGRRLSFGARLAALLYGPRGGFYQELGIADARFQQVLLEDFAGDLDVPHWKRWLMARLALDLTLQVARTLAA